jgi:uncharacterized damage-inducible protein DinB
VTAALDHVLRHNAWANKTLLEFCAKRDPSTLALTAAGTYGTLLETLKHLVSGEQWYISLLTSEVLGERVSKVRTVDELTSISELTGARAIAVAASDDPDRAVAIDGEPRASTVGTILAQLVHHGNEHRAQATTILGANGRDAPLISGWRYGIAAGISKHDGDN